MMLLRRRSANLFRFEITELLLRITDLSNVLEFY